MKRNFYITITLGAILILAGCMSFNRTPPRKIVNQRIPELAGGPEHRHRTGEHAYRMPNVVFFTGPGNVKQAALTFDDGPDVYFTPQILDILDKNNVKATFFIVGMRAQKNPDLVKRIFNAGHAIGNHTWDHPKLNRLSPEKLKSEVEQTENILTSITGYHTKLFRPPYGAADRPVVTALAAMGYKVIDWSVDTRDWAGTPPPRIMKFVHRELRPGGIILEHCAGGKGENLKNTVIALPQIISYLKEQGYKIVTIPELLGLTNNNVQSTSR